MNLPDLEKGMPMSPRNQDYSWIYTKETCLNDHFPYRMSLALNLHLNECFEIPKLVQWSMQEARLTNIRALIGWMNIQKIFETQLRIISENIGGGLGGKTCPGDLAFLFGSICKKQIPIYESDDRRKVWKNEAPEWNKFVEKFSSEQKAYQVLASFLIVHDFANKAIAHVTGDALRDESGEVRLDKDGKKEWNTKLKITNYKNNPRTVCSYDDELANDATIDAIYGLWILAEEFLYKRSNLCLINTLSSYLYYSLSSLECIKREIKKHHEFIVYKEFINKAK